MSVLARCFSSVTVQAASCGTFNRPGVETPVRLVATVQSIWQTILAFGLCYAGQLRQEPQEEEE